MNEISFDENLQLNGETIDGRMTQMKVFANKTAEIWSTSIERGLVRIKVFFRCFKILK